MAAPDIARYRPGLNATMLPDDEGPCVFFRDVEGALKDRTMLNWLMPILGGEVSPQSGDRLALLREGVANGLTGRQLVEWAMAKDSA